MLKPIELPNIGAEDEPVVVACWLVDPDERLVEGDRLVEVTVRGVLFEVRAPEGGVLRRVAVRTDEVVSEGGVLAWYEPSPTAGVAGLAGEERP